MEVQQQKHTNIIKKKLEPSLKPETIRTCKLSNLSFPYSSVISYVTQYQLQPNGISSHSQYLTFTPNRNIS